MAKRNARIRSVLGKPLITQSGLKIQMTTPLLRRAAQIILQSVKEEIRKDMAKARGVRGGTYPKPYADRNPVPLPQSRKFVNSFRWRIKGASTIEITSSWPTAEAHTKTLTQRGLDNMTSDRPDMPKGGFPMKWLVQPKVKYVPIVQHDGQVIIRTAPLSTDKAWIHPGFVKYNFIERGVRKGREKVVKEMIDDFLALGLEKGRLF